MKRKLSERIFSGVLACSLAAGMSIVLPASANAAPDYYGFEVHQMGQATLYTHALVNGSDGFNAILSFDDYTPKTISLTMTGDFTVAQQQAALDNNGWNYNVIIPTSRATGYHTALTNLDGDIMYEMLNGKYALYRNTYQSGGTISRADYSVIQPAEGEIKALSFHGNCTSFKPVGEENRRRTVRSLYLDDQLMVEWVTMNGRVISYKFHNANFQRVQEESSAAAEPMSARVFLDGNEADLKAYDINGNTYVKLGDIASLMRDTPAKFDVQWQSGSNTIELKPGKAYTPADGEQASLSPATAITAQSVITREYDTYPEGPDGFRLYGYSVGGEDFFKLRDIAHIAGFTVKWDVGTNSWNIKSEELTFKSAYFG